MLEFNVDEEHIGQILACLGLWELLNRDRPEYAQFRDGVFLLPNHNDKDLHRVIEGLKNTEVKGGVEIRDPITFKAFDLTINWYDTGDDKSKKGKSPTASEKEIAQFREQPVWKSMWGGQQKPGKMFANLQKLMSKVPVDSDMFRARVASASKDKFGFDFDSCWTGLGLGFSPNAHNLKEKLAPMLEVLSFIGAQTFVPLRDDRYLFYSVWDDLLPIIIARGVFGNRSVLSSRRYRTQKIQRTEYYSTFSRAQRMETD